jgi:hypothetical protein
MQRGFFSSFHSQHQISGRDARQHRDGDAEAYRERRSGHDGRVGGQRFGRRDADEERRRYQQPAAQVRKQDPAQLAVVGERALAPAGGVLEQRERVEVQQELAPQREARAGLAREQVLDFAVVHEPHTP